VATWKPGVSSVSRAKNSKKMLKVGCQLCQQSQTQRERVPTPKNLYTCTKKIISFQTQLKKVLPHSLVSPKQTNQNKIANRPKFLHYVLLYCHLNSINPNYSKTVPAVSPQCTPMKLQNCTTKRHQIVSTAPPKTPPWSPPMAPPKTTAKRSKRGINVNSSSRG
jgi:hypothetical protein